MADGRWQTKLGLGWAESLRAPPVRIQVLSGLDTLTRNLELSDGDPESHAAVDPAVPSLALLRAVFR